MVTFIHALYSQFLPKWARMRDVLGGEDAVKAAGAKYVPKLSDQSTEEFAAYIARPAFFPATGRTLDGLLGLIFRKDPAVVVPPDMESLLEDVTLMGNTFFGFAKHVTNEVLSTARFGIYVDYNSEQKRPYVVGYSAEQIINWRVEKLGETWTPTLIVLQETEVFPMADGFGTQQARAYRALVLEPRNPLDPSSDRVFRVKLFRPEIVEPQVGSPNLPTTAPAFGTGTAPNGGGAAFKETIIEPKIRGEMLKFIPFTFVGITRNDPTPEIPILEDIANVNLAHWRNSCDLEHGRHFTALPTAWVAGFGKDTVLRIGSGTAWVTDNPQAKAGFLEFMGTGLGALDMGIEQKEKQMQALGARILEQQKRDAEAAETLKVRQSGDASALASVATTIGEALTRALVWMHFWTTGKIETNRTVINCEVNTDYFDVDVDGPKLTALVAAWQANAISHLTLLYNLKTGEILPPEVDEEEEIERIQSEAPKLGGEPLPLDPTGNVPDSQKGAQDAAALAAAQKADEEKARMAAELKIKAKAGAGKK